MYLGLLDLEKRHLFLDLELHIAKSDGEFGNEEKAIVEYHCSEMHIDNNGFEPEMQFNEALETVNRTCTDEEKRIIFLELVAVVLADDKYKNEEKELIEKISYDLDVSEKEKDVVFRIIKSLNNIYKDMNAFIKGMI